MAEQRIGNADLQSFHLESFREYGASLHNSSAFHLNIEFFVVGTL